MVFYLELPVYLSMARLLRCWCKMKKLDKHVFSEARFSILAGIKESIIESSQRYTASEDLGSESIYTKDISFSGQKYGSNKKYSNDVYFVEQGRSELGSIQTVGDPFTYEEENGKLRVVTAPESEKKSIGSLIQISQSGSEDTTALSRPAAQENDYDDASDFIPLYEDMPDFNDLIAKGISSLDAVQKLFYERSFLNDIGTIHLKKGSFDPSTTFRLNHPDKNGWNNKLSKPGTEKTEALKSGGHLTDDFLHNFDSYSTIVDEWNTSTISAVSDFQKWIKRNVLEDITNQDAPENAKDKAMKFAGNIASNLLSAVLKYTNKDHPVIDDDTEVYNSARWALGGNERLLSQGQSIIVIASWVDQTKRSETSIEEAKEALHYAL